MIPAWLAEVIAEDAHPRRTFWGGLLLFAVLFVLVALLPVVWPS